MLERICRWLWVCAMMLVLPTEVSAFSSKDFLDAVTDESSIQSLKMQLESTTDSKTKREINKQIKEEERKLTRSLRDLRALAAKAQREGIDAQDGKGRTLLMLATQLPSTAGVDYLLQNNADATIRDKDGNTALRWDDRGGNGELTSRITAAAQDAATAGDYDALVKYCKMGISPDIMLVDGPLAGVLLKGGKVDAFLSVFRGRVGFRDAPMSDGMMVSELILQSGNDEVIKVGAEMLGKEIWEEGNSGVSPLFYLMSRGHLGGVKIYCHQMGVDSAVQQMAVRYSTPEVVSWVLAQSSKDTSSSRLPLLEAARRGNMAVYEAVLAAAPNAATVNANGETVLMHAALSGNAELVKAVLQKCSPEQIKATDNAGRSAVYYARLAVSPAVEQLLTGAGVTASDKDKP